jgi:glucosamine 6-phosphate synthetase-like amidotransferase/phosphosugar isomerase protein
MNKADYGNSLARQALLAPKMVKIMQNSMSQQKLQAVLPMKELWDAQQIIITGCGDSWLAGIAAKPVFESLAKMDVDVLRCVEFTRHFGAKRLGGVAGSFGRRLVLVKAEQPGQEGP